MAVIRPYVPQTDLRGLPTPGGSGGTPKLSENAPASAFGPSQTSNVRTISGTGQDLQTAGALLDRGSNSLGNIAEREIADQNETRVQDLANQYITTQQGLLYTGDDAYFKKKGRDAIDARDGVTAALSQRKTDLLELAQNDWQKRRLTTILNSHANDAFQSVAKYALVQQTDYDTSVAKGRLNLINSDAVLQANDTDKLDGLATAAEDTARKVASTQGLTGTDAEGAMVAGARSTVYRNAIETRVKNGDGRMALALWDRVRPKLDAKDNEALASVMKSTADDVSADDWISTHTGNSGVGNNIGNITRSVAQYAGGKGAPSGPFETFQTPEHGVAAAYQLIKNKVDQNGGALTFAQLIGGNSKVGGWAPADDGKDPMLKGNKVEPYANALAKSVGLTANDPIPIGDDAKMASVLKAMNLHEKGRMTVTDAAFDQGVKLAKGDQSAVSSVGFDKASGEGLVKAALDAPDLNPQTRAAVVTKLQKQITTTESARSATLKGLDDTLEATTQLMIAAPQAYSKGMLSKLADGYDAAGDKSKAINTRILAGFEDQLLAFSQSPDAAQNKIIESLLPGKAKALASGILAGDAKDAAENTKAARDSFAAIKTATDNGVGLVNQGNKIKEAFDFAVKGHDRSLVAEMSDWLNGRAGAEAAGQAPPAALTQLISDLRGKVRAGDQTNSSIIQIDQLQKIADQQATAFAKDPMAAGSAVYQNVGALAPLTDMPSRVAQADRIATNRGMKDISPYTEPEIAQIKQQVEAGDPQSQAKAFAQIAATVPARMIPKVAMQIAGKGDGDPLSRSYAAALSFFAEQDPASQQIAGQILQGAKITRDLGEAGKKAPTADQAWQDTLQERMGNTFRDMGTKVPAVFADAIASVYTYQMHRLGRQGEKIDTDVLDSAAKAVLGDTITRNGQKFLPPAKGVDSYAVDRALRSMSDGDLDGLKTKEGDPITADAIIRRGILTNAGPEGMYYVRVPDPRAGMDPRPIVRPDGQPWQLDLRPLLERSRMFPPGFDATAGQKPTEMRRRPVPPTLNDAPTP